MKKTQERSLLSATILIMGLTILSRIVGFARESTIAALFGATAQTDAYYMASNAVDLVFSIIGMGCISAVFQPYYSRLSIFEGGEHADRFASNTINVLFVVGLLMSALIFAFAEPVMRFFAPKFSAEQLTETTQMSRIIVCTYSFSVISTILAAALNSKKRFWGPQLMNMPISLSVIAGGLLFSKRFGIYAIVYANMLGWILQLVMMGIFSRSHIRYYRVFQLSDAHIKSLLRLAIPTFIGIFIGDINTTIDRMLASGLAEGSISGMNFASRLMGLINGILTLAISTATFPNLSEYIAKKNTADFSATINRSVSVLAFLLIPLTPFVIVFRGEIVRLVFERGAFDRAATAMTANVFAFYAFALFFIALREIISRAFYAMQDTKTPMLNGVVSIALNIVLNLILVRTMQASGLALGTSISTMVCSLSLLWSLHRRVNGVFSRALLKNMLKIALAATLAIFAASAFAQLGHIANVWVSFIMNFLVAVLAYVIVCWALKVDELGWGLDKMARHFASRRK